MRGFQLLGARSANAQAFDQEHLSVELALERVLDRNEVMKCDHPNYRDSVATNSGSGKIALNWIIRRRFRRTRPCRAPAAAHHGNDLRAVFRASLIEDFGTDSVPRSNGAST
jgi:hypothetical protein